MISLGKWHHNSEKILWSLVRGTWEGLLGGQECFEIAKTFWYSLMIICMRDTDSLRTDFFISVRGLSPILAVRHIGVVLSLSRRLSALPCDSSLQVLLCILWVMQRFQAKIQSVGPFTRWHMLQQSCWTQSIKEGFYDIAGRWLFDL